MQTAHLLLGMSFCGHEMSVPKPRILATLAHATLQPHERPCSKMIFVYDIISVELGCDLPFRFLHFSRILAAEEQWDNAVGGPLSMQDVAVKSVTFFQ